MTSPTQRTLQHLRREGWICQVVEQWVPMGRSGGVRRDLWGFVDILALKSGTTLAIQCTSKGEVSKRERKIRGTQPLPEDPVERSRLEEQNARIGRALTECWAAGWQVEVWGWEKGARVPVVRPILPE